jgi:glycosyltransferase involved in cell wall biosynthesis
MKILIAAHHYLDPNAGASGATLRLAEQYQQQGHEIYFYSFENLPHKFSELAEAMMFPGLVAIHIDRLVKQQSIDVVEAMTGDAWLWGKFLQNFNRNRPLLVTQSHGLEHRVHLERLEDARRGTLHLSWKYPLWHGGFGLWEVATSLRCADLSFMLNHQDADFAREQLNVKPERIHVFPNGISESLLNLPFAPMTEFEDGMIGIAQVGSYTSRKGIHYSIPALNAILARYPKVKVSFLGTGCSEDQVYADFDPIVRDRVLVIPSYANEQLPNLLQGHQIKLMPSLSEGFGLALVEAMACGLVPITTAIQGPMEIVTDGHDGLLVPIRDSQAIKQTIEQLIKNRPYLEQLRRNAYVTAQRYSWTDIAKKRLAIYENTLDKRSHVQ